MPRIHLLARGVLLKQGQLLLAHLHGAAHTFLPGGHIEAGEPAARALERELREELGLKARAGAFLGAVEHRYLRRETRWRHEVNLIFAFEAGIEPGEPLVSREPRLEFFWRPLDRLAQANLQPDPLQSLLPRRLAGGAGPLWASTLANP
ncbi:MAG: NUDIX domain-containing protein [Planctomycetota bacterium]|nr:NUDIX domain-containing protein [Planctomycetota bacterium]